MKRRAIIRQPIDLADGKCYPKTQVGGWISMLRPGAFYFHAGKLYVGYGWLSSFHEGERPVWDPVPVPQDAVIETCCGYYHFSNMFKEGAPYWRAYAELTLRRVHRVTDGPHEFLKTEVVHTIPIEEKLVIPPDYYLEYQWHGGAGGSEQVLHRMWRDPNKVMYQIRKSPSLKRMRFSPEAKRLHQQFTTDTTCIHGMRPE